MLRDIFSLVAVYCARAIFIREIGENKVIIEFKATAAVELMMFCQHQLWKSDRSKSTVALVASASELRWHCIFIIQMQFDWYRSTHHAERSTCYGRRPSQLLTMCAKYESFSFAQHWMTVQISLFLSFLATWLMNCRKFDVNTIEMNFKLHRHTCKKTFSIELLLWRSRSEMFDLAQAGSQMITFFSFTLAPSLSFSDPLSFSVCR